MRGVVVQAAAALLVLGIVALGVVASLHLRAQRYYAGRVYQNTQGVPPRPVALVLGAGLDRSGRPTPALADRVAVAAELYQAGVVQKLLLSGDHRFIDYNEPEAMRQHALALGVSDEDIVLDYAGRRTYDSCYRAQAIFRVEQAVVITQRFHLLRALYLCDALGIEVVGVVADRQPYGPARHWWRAREFGALALAWWDVNVRRPVPVLGDPLPIQYDPRGGNHES